MIPSDAVRLDVPVAPHGINVATGSHEIHSNHGTPTTNRKPQLSSQNQNYYPHRPLLNQLGLEYMTPPTPASHNHYHLEIDKPLDSDDYVINDDSSYETEGGEVIQESNSRPLRPGEIPIELIIQNKNKPSTSMPIDPIDDYTTPKSEQHQESHFKVPTNGINISIVNSKPMHFEDVNPALHAPPAIINGKPSTAFNDKAQATISIGSPTNLKPNDFHYSDDKSSDHKTQTSIENFIKVGQVHDDPSQHDDRPVYVKPQYFDTQTERPMNQINNKPAQYDNTLPTMNIDEKPPPIAPSLFETRPDFEQPLLLPGLDLDTHANTPRPFSAVKPNKVEFDRNSQHDESVLGLAPPPRETTTRPVINVIGTRRPQSNRVKPRPLPPYKFEIPPPPSKPTIQIKPQRIEPNRFKIPAEVLAPPQPSDEYYIEKIPKKPQVTAKNEILKQWLTSTTPRPESINPVLGGVLTVEELPQKPEVITADSKVVLSNVIKGQRVKGGSEIRITGTEPAMQTVIIGQPVLDNQPDNIKPTTVFTTEWQNSIIVGSEATILEEETSETTPIVSVSKPSTTTDTPSFIEVTTGMTTVFGNIFTRPVETNKYIKPTKSTQIYHNVISMVVEPDTTTTEKFENSKEEKEELLKVENSNHDATIYNPNVIVTLPKPTTFVVTHTQTLTVTSTETTVLHSKGKDPSTHTVVLTKTQTSTLLDTVTEIRTLVKPTSILSTVTTTVPQATTTVYPPTSPFDPDNYPYYTKSTEFEKVTEEITTKDPHENESIFVVMTDKKQGSAKVHTHPPPEIQVPDETNEISPNVLLGGLLTLPSSDSECRPECKATRNELCQKIDNVMRCVCRPGFARMFPDRPCKPTYTYTIKLVLDRYGKDHIKYSESLNDSTSSHYQVLSEATREGLDRMVMQSDLRDIYHGVAINGFSPVKKPENTMVRFYVQLSDNTEENRLQDVLRKSLRSNNFSLGGTEVFASKDSIQYLIAEDFDECSNLKFHDCSEDAHCFNLRGTYTCSCKEGFTDLSHNALFPGRVCSAEQIGCDQCNYHGTCYSRNDNEVTCECFQWYAGEQCQINLKVLLLVLSIVGVCLMVLLVVCLVMSCIKHRGPSHGGPPPLRPGVGFRRYRNQIAGDKRAMISIDTSSEGSVENTPPPYIKQAVINTQRQKVMRKSNKPPAPSTPTIITHGTVDQRDRSLTVMIPRAKYRPAPVQPTSTLLTMSTFGPEQKLINYLTGDGTNTPEKHGSRNTSRKPSNSTNHSEPVRTRKPSSQSPAPRKPSIGALVSAGFEVSATVGRTKELDESFVSEPHTDLGQQGFNTIRTAESCIIVNIPPPPTLEAELEDIMTKVNRLTVSEARSYDETTIQPPTKSINSSSHQGNNDEGHTMVERDLGSTFVLPQTHLFKTDRGSDISNFDSL
uniref:EGF-like domain-containing protein n=2 Tax=Clastoptera arizonana TaxID=38151 RepID=A0A1B6D0I9_9HEMI